jgi:hypothetical protein
VGFCLKPNTVYMTIPTPLGVTVFQPMGGDIQLFGTNVTRYSNKDGNKRIIVPDFDELILIWDDWMQDKTVNPMNTLTTFIGFKSKNPDAVVWVNNGIEVKVTPPFDINLGQ